MAKKSILIVNKKKKLGRPLLYAEGGGKGAPLTGVRLPPDEAKAVDDWIARQSELLSRPEAIRRLIKIALKKGGKSAR